MALISELVGILHTMVKCGDLEISNQAMNDILAENGMDVFEMLLEVRGMSIGHVHSLYKACGSGRKSCFTFLDRFAAKVAASSANPDPLFLAISYESVYVFVQSDIMRPRVLSKVISRLRETAILLPYIRGPYIKDVPNEKYMQLWCKCELKYGMKNDARERLEKRYTSLDPDEHSQWRELVPEIRELQPPVAIESSSSETSLSLSPSKSTSSSSTVLAERLLSLSLSPPLSSPSPVRMCMLFSPGTP